MPEGGTDCKNLAKSAGCSRALRGLIKHSNKRLGKFWGLEFWNFGQKYGTYKKDLFNLND